MPAGRPPIRTRRRFVVRSVHRACGPAMGTTGHGDLRGRASSSGSSVVRQVGRTGDHSLHDAPRSSSGLRRVYRAAALDVRDDCAGGSGVPIAPPPPGAGDAACRPAPPRRLWAACAAIERCGCTQARGRTIRPSREAPLLAGPAYHRHPRRGALASQASMAASDRRRPPHAPNRGGAPTLTAPRAPAPRFLADFSPAPPLSGGLTLHTSIARVGTPRASEHLQAATALPEPPFAPYPCSSPLNGDLGGTPASTELCRRA